MADQDTSLPVRTQADGTDERLHVKIVDGTNPAVNQMTVDSDKNAHVEAHGNDPGGVDRVVRTSEQGALTPDGLYDATNNTKPGNIGVILGTRSATPGDATQNLRPTAIAGTNDTVCADVAIRDESGTPFSDTNPLPVTITDVEGGTDVHSYHTSTAVAAAASVNHDYMITAAKTMRLRDVKVSGSGKIKAELKYSLDGLAFSTLMVYFNSTADTNIEFDLSMLPKAVTGTGSLIRVVITNRDNQAQDVYSLIIGSEV